MDRHTRKYKPGDSIESGERIGFVGKTGRATGIHLHFQIDNTIPTRHPYFPNRYDGSADGEKEVNAPDTDRLVANRTYSPMKFVQDYMTLNPLFSIQGSLNGAQEIGAAPTKNPVGQTIRNADILPGLISGIEVTLGKVGNPTDSVIISLRNDLHGDDLTSVAVSAAALPTHPDSLTLSLQFDAPIPSNFVNYLVLRRSGAFNAGPGYAVLRHHDARGGINTYRCGNYFECDGLTCDCACILDNVGEPAYDVVFKLFGTPYASASPRLAFSSNRDGNYEIYVMNADGSGQHSLTCNPAIDGGPRWSPDGSKIAFQSNRTGNYDIYIMEADGSNLRQITSNQAQDGDLSWSPDGEWITFRTDRDGNDEIYKVSPVDPSVQINLTNNPNRDGEPRWSPNGDKILFSSWRNGSAEIFVMDADGLNVLPITTPVTWSSNPTWSPDETKIAYSSFGNVLIANANGSNPQATISSIGDDYVSSWSSDGPRLAFFSNRDGDFEIFSYNTATTAITQLTSNTVDDQWPDWSPTSSGSIPKTVSVIRQPGEFRLEHNYPNPFNPSTTIRYSVAEGSQVRLIVYNLLGQEVVRLVDGYVEAGEHSVQFTASDFQSGVYFYRLQAGTHSEMLKLVFLK